MFHADKPLPPPPVPTKPRNKFMSLPLPTYHTRPQTNNDALSNFSVSSARAFFETTKIRRTENLTSIGFDQVEKHPEIAKKAMDRITSENPPPSVRTLMGELESKLIFSHEKRAISSERNEKVNGAFSQYSDKVPCRQPLHNRHSFSSSSRKQPPRRPPPPKLKASSRFSSDASDKIVGPSTPKARIKYRLVSSHFDELSCQENDTLQMKKQVDENWVYTFNTRTAQYGIVPISFLDVKVPLNSMPDLTKQHIRDGPRCVSLYAYSSGVVGDLAFETDETIRLLRRINSEWLDGETADGRRGIFPNSFVRLVQDLPFEVTKNSILERTAAYDYNSSAAGDLVFSKGDRIQVLETIDSDWAQGRLISTPSLVGLFPTSYLQPIEDGQWSGLVVVALFDYESDTSGDLWFSKGDRIKVTGQLDVDWLKGRLILDMANEKAIPEGIFPLNFVRLE